MLTQIAVKQSTSNSACTDLFYRKNLKISDTRKFIVITLKVEQDGVSLGYCIQKMQRELQAV